MKTQKKSLQNLSAIFPNTKLYFPKKNESIMLKDLWEKNTAPFMLLHWLRRFGCPVCRLGAKNLSEMVEKSRKENPDVLNYAGIGLSKIDYEDFEKGNFFKGDIYIDENKDSFKLLRYNRLGMNSMFGLLNFNMYKMIGDARNHGIKGNLKGDRTQLGGTIICDKKGDVLFSHIQSSYSDYPKDVQMFESVKSYRF